MQLTRILAHARRRTARLVRFARDDKAVVLIETAFTMPLLVFLGFGGLEIANLTLANTRISQVALSAADNASRIAYGSDLSLPRVREVDINEVFAGVEEQSRGLDFKAHGRIILSSLERNSSGGQWIHWQRCYGNYPVNSAYGLQGTGKTGTAFKGMGKPGAEVTAATGTAVMFVEVTYQYQPLAFAAWLGPRVIRTTAAFNIREGRDLQGPTGGDGVYNPSPAATKMTCT